MLDINLFRTEKGGDPEVVRESQRRRFADVTLVDKVIELDSEWRQVRFQLDQLNKDFNALNKEIATVRKSGGNSDELQERSKEMKKRIQETEEREKEVIRARDSKLVAIGNIVHDSVPVSQDETNNAVVKTFGEPRPSVDPSSGKKLYNHVDLVQLLGIVNLEAGQEVAGGRGYYLTHEGVLLNQALINAAVHFAYKRGFAPVHTPFFMRQEIMAECAQLSQFDEELYKVTGEGDDKYLIATSEQTLCAMHRKGWFEKAELPVKYVGYSTCFRKEVGSHGRDTLGIFRIHQFEKVEQFVIASPEGNSSWEAMEEMLANAEDFYQSLGLPYRVVNIVSGELNNAASKKYDLEAWFPASATFRELVSCSNCLDYQSRRLDIRLRTPKGAAGEASKAYVHMLNSTLTATERTLCCVLENYQTPDGVRVPEALRPFMMGMEFIPFRKQFDAKGKLVDRPKPAAAPAAAAAEASS
ncbi:hypothetical protein Agub_g1051 [Astrephomene gubernaculifera]|uniref:serine--tRNA ligase n=1 Tax=Astrephomene gubernaculifera TaxID=47775 RepID=A0AAD3DEQ9_9CHLO|nr:hypothetical protein Agub_g1051 [Astrephomene gubernaculifera]